MSGLRTFFRLGLGQFKSKRNMILLLLIFMLSLYATQKGISEYKQTLIEIQEFNKLEEIVFKTMGNYSNYSYFGFKTIFIPWGTSVYFSNLLLTSEFVGRVNSIYVLDINNNLKGGGVLRGNSVFRFRLSTIFLLLGSLSALFLGYESVRNKEYLKQLVSKLGFVRAHLVQSARLLSLFLFFLAVFGVCIVQAVLQGIPVTGAAVSNLADTLPPLALALAFTFFIGAIVGLVKSKSVGVALILGLWVILLFLYPASIDSWVEDRSYEISSSYSLDSEKKGITREFEERARKKYGDFKNNTAEGRKKVIEEYWHNDFPKVEAVDEKNKTETARVIEVYNKISLLLPTTFYKLVCDEAGSRGYQAYLAYYSYLQDLRRRFARFWFDRVYYHDVKELVNFVRHDENLFYSRGHRPPGYKTGVWAGLVEVIILYMISLLLFRRSLVFIGARELKELGKVKMGLMPGQPRIWAVRDHRFGGLLFHAFKGLTRALRKKGFTGGIAVNRTDITKTRNPHPFVYIPHYRELPAELKVKDLLLLYAGINGIKKETAAGVMAGETLIPLLGKSMEELKDGEKFEVVLGFLEMGGNYIYVLDKLAYGLPMPYCIKLARRMNEMAKTAVVILLISPEEMDLVKPPEGEFYWEGQPWLYKAMLTDRETEMKAKLEKANVQADQAEQSGHNGGDNE